MSAAILRTMTRKRSGSERDWWSGYIRDRFPEPRLREAFVICLPGRKVEPEVSKYL